MNPAATSDKPPFNRFLVPAFLYTEVVSIGLFFMAVMIFMEKGEGTIRAFQVAGQRICLYLFSKSVILALLAVFFCIIVTAAVLGLRNDWISVLALVLLGSFFSSSAGILLASFHRNLSEAILPIIVLLTSRRFHQHLTFSPVSLPYGLPGFRRFPLFLPWARPSSRRDETVLSAGP